MVAGQAGGLEVGLVCPLWVTSPKPLDAQHEQAHGMIVCGIVTTTAVP
jgi:hypothetical protein